MSTKKKRSQSYEVTIDFIVDGVWGRETFQVEAIDNMHAFGQACHALTRTALDIGLLDLMRLLDLRSRSIIRGAEVKSVFEEFRSHRAYSELN